jgi:hypothetical protein
MPASPQIQTIAAGEKRTVAIDFSGKLSTSGTDELLSSSVTAPTVTATPSGLTFGTPTISTQIEDVLGKAVPIGKALLVTVDAAAAAVGTLYTLVATVKTDAGNILKDSPRLRCDM